MHYSFEQGAGEYHCAVTPKPLVAETQEIGVVLQLEAYLKKKYSVYYGNSTHELPCTIKYACPSRLDLL